MTRKMNRTAAKGWADDRDRKRHEEAEAERLKDGLDALRRLRIHLLSNRRGDATQALIDALDDYAGVLTGDRKVLWSDNFRHISVPFKAP
jgi:hypothetical protein